MCCWPVITIMAASADLDRHCDVICKTSYKGLVINYGGGGGKVQNGKIAFRNFFLPPLKTG